MKRLMIIVIALLLGIVLPIYVWHVGGIWRIVSITLLGADILALLTKESGPFTFLWKHVSNRTTTE